uniref:Uncharacterized protein n=1 Tax=Arundo donax TaxID=35708 RepID=A0A0A9ACS9_ARUDO
MVASSTPKCFSRTLRLMSSLAISE